MQEEEILTRLCLQMGSLGLGTPRSASFALFGDVDGLSSLHLDGAVVSEQRKIAMLITHAPTGMSNRLQIVLRGVSCAHAW